MARNTANASRNSLEEYYENFSEDLNLFFVFESNLKRCQEPLLRLIQRGFRIFSKLKVSNICSLFHNVIIIVFSTS